MRPTNDPDVFIEVQQGDYVRYFRQSDGLRWEVRGRCDQRGDCLIGAVIDGVQIRDHDHIKELQQQLGNWRIETALDVPVGPAPFSGCCPLVVTVLDN